ncbi:MAG TPA: hydrogenase maturation nickel metallochaperone HypA [Candidatus Binatia bacterium]|nr:hydrogenase maturation nickel metallochaperone HypA [Candidatus Binatia bacterium]
MHEYGIVEALLQRVDEVARGRGATRVRRVRLRLGELAGVEPTLLAAAYAAFRERTCCAEAALDVEPVAARWSCPGCARPIARGEVLRCPACGAPARLVAGDEIVLYRVELEVP